MNYYVGQSVESIDIVDEDCVKKFAEISGDYNPIHIDEEYAKNTRFNNKIVHGMLASSFISKVIGMQLPGLGTIYLSQNLRFIRPIYIGETIRTRVCIIDIISEKNQILLETRVFNGQGDLCIDGNALVLKE